MAAFSWKRRSICGKLNNIRGNLDKLWGIAILLGNGNCNEKSLTFPGNADRLRKEDSNPIRSNLVKSAVAAGGGMEGAAEAPGRSCFLQRRRLPRLWKQNRSAQPSARSSHAASCCRLHKEVSAGTKIGGSFGGYFTGVQGERRRGQHDEGRWRRGKDDLPAPELVGHRNLLLNPRRRLNTRVNHLHLHASHE